jgi:hypothetical protein
MKKTLPILTALCCAAILPAEKDSAEFDKKLGGDQQILHALDRLTFGPRPGDIDAVKAMGLSQWIDLQLHPERIPESAELAKLVEPLVEPKLFPLERLLTPQQIRLLRTGTAQEARDFLATLPPEKAEQVLTQMPVVRQKVGAAAASNCSRRSRSNCCAPDRIKRDWISSRRFPRIRLGRCSRLCPPCASDWRRSWTEICA